MNWQGKNLTFVIVRRYYQSSIAISPVPYLSLLKDTQVKWYSYEEEFIIKKPIPSFPSSNVIWNICDSRVFSTLSFVQMVTGSDYNWTGHQSRINWTCRFLAPLVHTLYNCKISLRRSSLDFMQFFSCGTKIFTLVLQFYLGRGIKHIEIKRW